MEPFYKEKKRILQFNNKVSSRVTKIFRRVILSLGFHALRFDLVIVDCKILNPESLKSFTKVRTQQFT